MKFLYLMKVCNYDFEKMLDFTFIKYSSPSV